MTEQKTLAEKSGSISDKLLNSIYLVEILSDIVDGEAHEATLLEIVRQNLKSAFQEVEECRELISLPD